MKVRELAADRKLDLEGLLTMFNEVGARADASKNPQARATKTPGNRPLIGGPNDYFWHGNTAPTPASDGKVVVAKVGCEQWGYLVCYDLDGNRKWSRDIGHTGCWHASYDSPLIIGDVVVSQATIRDVNLPDPDGKMPRNNQSLLVAFDLATGEPRWRVQTKHSTSSPIPLELDGVKCLHHGGVFLLPGDGTLLLDTTGFYGTDVDTPVVQGDLFFTRGAEGKTLIASPEPEDSNRPFEVRPDPAVLVRKPARKKEMEVRLGVPNEDDMSVALGGTLLFGCPSDWPRQFIVVPVSPTAASGADLKAISTQVMDAPVIGSPFFQGDRMYVRDYRYLYCIGEK